MGIIGAVDQGRPKRRERSFVFRAEDQLARGMHHAVGGRGRRRRSLGDRIGLVSVDRIGADIEQVRRGIRDEGGGRGLRHAQIGHHLRRVLCRRHRRDEDHGIVRPQQRREIGGRIGGEKIELAALQGEDGDISGLQRRSDRATHETAADDDGTGRCFG